jgi:hypothetical protein
VGAGSGLVLTLAGVLKDVLLVAGSVVIWGGEVGIMQAFGAFCWVWFRCSPCIDVSLRILDSIVWIGDV